MQREKITSIKGFLSITFLLVAATAFSQSSVQKKNSPKERPEVIYKQVHGSNLNKDNTLIADGFKLKLDLSVLEEAEASREIEEFDPTQIPADDVYGGVWENSHVNVYGMLKNAPDTFMVDLSNFTMPCEGRMTSNFGRRGGHRYHYGIDIKAQVGDTIYAAFDGKVRVREARRTGFGHHIVIRHVNGLETVYAHMSKFLVNLNDFVKSGQPIGLAGNTGRSFGSHLHFETRFLGKPINPNFLIDFENKVCHRDEYLITRSSYNKTNRSSRVVTAGYNPNSNYRKATSSTNKYVSGNVKYHRIKRGETLGAIARRYGVSVSRICSLNNITPRTTLRVGKSLRVS